MVRRIFDMRIQGQGIDRIARALTDEGKSGKCGGEFTPTGISKILGNRNYAG